MTTGRAAAFRKVSMAIRPRANLQPKQPGSTVPVKRVIRRDGRFVCGMCRKPYATEAEAEKCLEGCLSSWLRTAPPINEVKGGDAKQFRCGFCKRVYTARNEAQSCADACRKKTQKSVDSERSVSPSRALAAGVAPKSAVAASAADDDDDSTSSRFKAPKFGREHMHKFLRDGRKLICRKCGAERATMEAVIACFDGHVAPPKAVKVEKPAPSPKPAAPKPIDPPVVEATTAPAAAAPTPVEAPPQRTRSLAHEDDGHKFYRDGARYICRNCNAKYFTRGDVVACFDGH